MKSIVVVGAQWGDEGKGKVVDYMAASFDYIARCAGGHNAGHTVIFDGHRFVLQLIPCGMLRPGRHAVIGTGVVVDPAALVAELDSLGQAGIDVNGRLHLSNRAHVIFPYHRQMEKAAEAARGAAKIGTTSRGIGPAYEDKMARSGIRVCDLMEPARFREKLARVVRDKDAICRAAYGAPLEVEGLAEQYLAYAERLRPFVIDTSSLLNRALDEAVRAVRGRAGHHAGHRLRHVSVRHLVECHCRRRLHRSGCGAYAYLGCRGSHQGLHHACGQRSVPHGNARSRRARSARSRQRVWRRHRAPAPLRMAGPGHAALCGYDEWNHVAHRHQARRFRYAARNSGVRRLLSKGIAIRTGSLAEMPAAVEDFEQIARNTARCRAG